MTHPQTPPPTEPIQTVTVAPSPSVLVLAAGATQAARNAARGKLFEHFVALLLERYGYTPPTDQNLRVTSAGIELDVVTALVATGQPAIVECKAYTSNVEAKALTAFYGKLSTQRFAQPATFGWFFALPRLTAEADEHARLIAKDDANFRVMTASHVADALEAFQLTFPPPASIGLQSDHAVVITEHGIYSTLKELDQTSRLPAAVRVWGRTGGVPQPVVDLLAASPYAGGSAPVLPVEESAPAGPPAEPAVIEVAGSTSDFEYQLPASPAFFVGRSRLLTELRRFLASEPSRGRVLVLNAQSGWGKSSLALRLSELVTEMGGVALVADTRTASSPEYVSAALRKLILTAQDAALLSTGASTSFGSLSSALATLADADWLGSNRPLFLFFDQFENVFRDPELTREFRDLALATTEATVPLVLGFAWKTDLVTWSEAHPYRLRDEIRDRAHSFTLEVLGPREVETLIVRLAEAVGEPLQLSLRQQLREYSQGLPWLFKKLAGHILRELQAGTSQESLLAESLNIKGLFESDVSELGPQEHEALKTLARMAPVPVSEAVELVSTDVIQALLNRRLITQVGERLDTYWDIFRDYLVTGSVPIRETFIIRERTGSVRRLLRELVRAEGPLSILHASARLRTSDRAVYNLARELRQLGVASAVAGSLRIKPEIQNADDREATMRSVVTDTLRRHTAYSLLERELRARGGEIRVGEYAQALPQAFPAVEAKRQTWESYARAFVSWFRYAGLVQTTGDRVRTGSEPRPPELLSVWRQPRRQATFPQGRPDPVVQFAAVLAGHRQDVDMSNAAASRALTDAVTLGIIDVDEDGVIHPRHLPNDESGAFSGALLRERLTTIPGAEQALKLLERNPSASTVDVGALLRDGQRTEWRDSTTKWAGGAFPAWARAAGVATSHADTTTRPPVDGP